MLNSVAVAGLLYAIELTEGVRQLSDDAIVMRQEGLGPWRVVRPHDVGLGLRVVSWCLPLNVPLVVEPSATPDLPVGQARARARRRLRRVGRAVVALRVLGFVTLATIVVGLPLAVDSFGLGGLLVAVVALLALSVTQSVWTSVLLRRMGAARKTAFLTALKLLSPFSAPRAPEYVYENATRGVPPLALVHFLLGDIAFVNAMRREVYDLVASDASRELELVKSLLGADRLEELLRTPPDGCEAGAFCPRCAMTYEVATTDCADCDGVPLQKVATSRYES